jgi:hypothetical protein
VSKTVKTNSKAKRTRKDKGDAPRSKGQPGPDAMYRNKDRTRPISLHLTGENHEKLENAMARKSLSRPDVLNLLVDKFSAQV